MKCTACNAPVDRTEDGRIRFDSSQYHMDAVKKLSEISALRGYIEDLEAVIKAAREVNAIFLGSEDISLLSEALANLDAIGTQKCE